MSQKLLIITEKPNKDANKNCQNQSDLFNLNKNPFSQFFGRIIFGEERNYRKYFNHLNFLWKHAEYELKKPLKNDGEEAIKEIIKSNLYEIIVTFGKSAMNVILGGNEDLKYKMKEMRDRPLQLGQLNEKEYGKNDTSLCYFLPHPSSQTQHYWKIYVFPISDIIQNLQIKINNMVLEEYHYKEE